nr:MAG TPA: hypothetical protein [Caudoviricetes sp.]
MTCKKRLILPDIIKIMALKMWLIRCVFILLDFNINKPLG